MLLCCRSSAYGSSIILENDSSTRRFISTVMSNVLCLRYPLSRHHVTASTVRLRGPYFTRQPSRSYQRQSSSTVGKVVFSGIQPTGVPHLGNYVGALQQWVQIQDNEQPTSDVLFSIVDLHAMTLSYDGDQLRHWKRQTLAALLAVGLKAERSAIFFQSAV